jgi:hypothetical protein
MASCRKWRSQEVRHGFLLPLWRDAAEAGEATVQSSMPQTPKVRFSASMLMERERRWSLRTSELQRINPTAGPSFFPMAPISYSGRATSETSRTTVRAASTSVLLKARRENLLPSAIPVLATMPTIYIMRTSKGSW